MPGAEPAFHEGGPIGVLLLHGFAGSPQPLRPWGAHLAERGYTVDVPRLPGHGTTLGECNLTRWDDWYGEASRSLAMLSERCEQVFVGGLSMGGALALRLAQTNPERVAGLMLVNPAIASRDWKLRFLMPALHHVITKFPPVISNDIKQPGVTEVAHEWVPVQALWSLTQDGWPRIVADLPSLRVPTIVFKSMEDHSGVDESSLQLLQERSGIDDLAVVFLHNSYHVATLDHDAEVIFERSHAFVERVVRDGVAA
jgi:carboxylesterase